MATAKADAETKSDYEYEFRKDYQEDYDVHSKYVQQFDPLESMLIGMVFDSVSNSIDGSKITDSYAATLAIERAARVMGKLPDGVTQAVGSSDQGKAVFMDILRQKWIYPNANSQFPFETKLELAQLYSDVYGYMPIFYDWNVNPNGYVGPDCWLFSPRNLVFQQGRNFFADMDYVTALTWVGPKFLEDVIEASGAKVPDDEDASDDATEPAGEEKSEVPQTQEDGWNIDALQELLNLAKTQATNPDYQKNTRIERTRMPQGTKKGICLATRYEAGEDGEWITFAPDHGFCEVRRLKNPHKNSRIPFRIKYSQELYDSVYGIGDFARAKPIQFARDGLTNFYFSGIKMNLLPPLVVNANGVLKHTLDYRAGAVMMETIPNSVRRLETSNAGLATYQAAQSALTGSLLTIYGSQNAATPGAEALNPQQGKTPAAINLYSDKEASRDGRARKRLENLVEELTDAFFSLIVNIGTETIPVALFAEDIQAIVDAGMTDVTQLVKNFKPNATQTGGDLKIDMSKLTDVEFRFNIEPDSTAKVNQDNQRQQLDTLVGNIAKFQNQLKDDPTIAVNWAEIMKAYAALSNIPNASKFVTNKTPEQMQADQQAAAQAAQTPVKSPIETIAYKDVPEDVKRELEQQAGLKPSQMVSPSATDQAVKHAQIMDNASKTSIAANDHALKVGQAMADATHSDRQHALDVGQAMATATHNDNQHVLATSTAANQAQQAQDSHALQTAQAVDSSQQASKSHDLAVKVANKPTPKPAKK